MSGSHSTPDERARRVLEEIVLGHHDHLKTSTPI